DLTVGERGGELGQILELAGQLEMPARDALRHVARMAQRRGRVHKALGRQSYDRSYAATSFSHAASAASSSVRSFAIASSEANMCSYHTRKTHMKQGEIRAPKGAELR